MTLIAAHVDPPVEDSFSNVLKWVLLVVAIATFGLLAWGRQWRPTAPRRRSRTVSSPRTGPC
jgi:nitric oxide reductase subunit B